MKITNMFLLIKSIDKAYEQTCVSILKEFNISQTSFDIIMFLANNPQYYTAKEISVKRNLKPNLVSLYVEKLAAAGLLERHPFDGDRRKVKLVCTEKAQPIIDRGHEMQKNFFLELIEGLTQDELQIFKKCINIMTENAISKEKREKELSNA